MPPRSETKRARLARWIAEQSPVRIDVSMLTQIRASLGAVSEDYLRQLVRQTGVPMSPEVEGVVAASPAEMRRTLLALSEVYAEGGKQVRALVIEAKNRLKWARKRSNADPEKDAIREEMILWAMTWLENPEAFPLWIELRERAVNSQQRLYGGRP